MPGRDGPLPSFLRSARRPRPLSGRTTRSYLIVATPRAATTRMCELLRWDRCFGRPQEFFDPDHVPIYARRWGVPVPDGTAEGGRPYVEEMLRVATTPNGVFGAKLLFPHVSEALGLFGLASEPPDGLVALYGQLPGLRLIHLERQNKVKSAVSLWRAVESDTWLRRPWQGQRVEARALERAIDIAFVSKTHAEHHEADGRLRALLDGGAVGAHLDFEDVVSNPDGVVRQVADVMDVRWAPMLHRAARWQLPVSQSDGLTDRLVRQWVDATGGCAECGELPHRTERGRPNG
jgi:LPS sulfotransferase NodH